MTNNQGDLTENGTFDDVINVLNGRNGIRHGLRVHIVDKHGLHTVFGENRQDPYLTFDYKKDHIELFVTMSSRWSTPFFCGRHEDKKAS